MTPVHLRVGTRRSPLARIQTALVIAALRRRSRARQFVEVPLETTGDWQRAAGGSPDFTDRIDRALLRGEIDLAVHSAKDLPLALDPGLELVSCPPREDPRDVLVVGSTRRLTHLPPGARIGSSSPRRRAQILRWRPDVVVEEIRGNVDTRLALLEEGRLSAVVLAAAGLNRLDRRSTRERVLSTARFLPSPGQGALAVVARGGGGEAATVARTIDDVRTRACITAERRLAATLGAGCTVPLGALARARGSRLHLVGEALSANGRRAVLARASGPADDPERLGTRVGQRLLDAGARSLWAA